MHAIAVMPTEFLTRDPLVPAARARYLADIAGAGREARKTASAKRRCRAPRARPLSIDAGARRPGVARTAGARRGAPRPGTPALDALRAAYNRALDDIGVERSGDARGAGPRASSGVTDPEYSYTVRGREVRGTNYSESLSHSPSPSSRRRGSRAGARCSISCRTRICPALFPIPAACIRTDARKRIRRACSRVRARRSAPTAVFTTWPRATRPRGYPPPSTRPRCTARTPTCGPTSSAAPAIPAFRSPRSMT